MKKLSDSVWEEWRAHVGSSDGIFWKIVDERPTFSFLMLCSEGPPDSRRRMATSVDDIIKTFCDPHHSVAIHHRSLIPAIVAVKGSEVAQQLSFKDKSGRSSKKFYRECDTEKLKENFNKTEFGEIDIPIEQEPVLTEEVCINGVVELYLPGRQGKQQLEDLFNYKIIIKK